MKVQDSHMLYHLIFIYHPSLSLNFTKATLCAFLIPTVWQCVVKVLCQEELDV